MSAVVAVLTLAVMSRLDSEIPAEDSCCESPHGGLLTTGLKNERIPIDGPTAIQTFFGDGSVIFNRNNLRKVKIDSSQSIEMIQLATCTLPA